MKADLEAWLISTSDGVIYGIDIYPVTKHCQLTGLDDIGPTLANPSSIHTFAASTAQARPWLRGPMGFGKTTHNI